MWYIATLPLEYSWYKPIRMNWKVTNDLPLVRLLLGYFWREEKSNPFLLLFRLSHLDSRICYSISSLASVASRNDNHSPICIYYWFSVSYSRAYVGIYAKGVCRFPVINDTTFCCAHMCGKIHAHFRPPFRLIYSGRIKSSLTEWQKQSASFP